MPVLRYLLFGLRLSLFKTYYGRRLQLASFSQSLARGARIRILGQSFIWLGERVSVGHDTLLDAQAGSAIRLGKRVFLNRGCSVSARYSIEIGEETLIGEYVTIYDHNHVVGKPNEPRRLEGFRGAPVVIGRNVWIGSHVFVGAGVQIGDNAIIGAHTIVTKNVPADTITYGESRLTTKRMVRNESIAPVEVSQ